ncbi:MAG TPA: hypothetical protein DCE48_13315 [Lachnospiraceae bacterium]|jgi:vacuolar-type H+-ATPase subunit H|uniref:Uncharacterized protein n=1 Tax=Anaerosporobacter mobilis DSM 15930 TaxID=1120996 RepID=A0A1M7MW02_9FIRM|nr:MULTISPECIES: hypothetical protein [Anaerosporobacter]SHM94779.1 hypothetical protein SAMN02746066_04021 [Anaerosporobacter mobilis DSM 15930]HAB61649.1 hypothetical protein [Lachnospiraceae bacterium]
MSKVGKTMNSVAENVVKAGGVVTKSGGEVISEIGKKVGVSKDICNKVEDKADMLGKDMYYASRKIGNKVEDKTDMLGKDMYYASHKIGNKVEDVTKDIVDSTKKVYENIADKMK